MNALWGEPEPLVEPGAAPVDEGVFAVAPVVEADVVAAADVVAEDDVAGGVCAFGGRVSSVPPADAGPVVGLWLFEVAVVDVADVV